MGSGWKESNLLAGGMVVAVAALLLLSDVAAYAQEEGSAAVASSEISTSDRAAATGGEENKGIILELSRPSVGVDLDGSLNPEEYATLRDKAQMLDDAFLEKRGALLGQVTAFNRKNGDFFILSENGSYFRIPREATTTARFFRSGNAVLLSALRVGDRVLIVSGSSRALPVQARREGGTVTLVRPDGAGVLTISPETAVYKNGAAVSFDTLTAEDKIVAAMDADGAVLLVAAYGTARLPAASTIPAQEKGVGALWKIIPWWAMAGGVLAALVLFWLMVQLFFKRAPRSRGRKERAAAAPVAARAVPTAHNAARAPVRPGMRRPPSRR